MTTTTTTKTIKTPIAGLDTVGKWWKYATFRIVKTGTIVSLVGAPDSDFRPNIENIFEDAQGNGYTLAWSALEINK